MTDVTKDFDFDSTDTAALQIRYSSLREQAILRGDDVSTDTLREMVALCQVLRRRSSGPPKTARPKAIPTIDDL